MSRITWSLSLLLLSCMSVFAQAPINDNPCNATPLTVGTTCTFTQYTNAAATASAGVPAPGCAGYAGGDVWFSVTVPANGNVIVDSDEGVMTNGGMAFYTGTCGSLTLLSCDNNASVNGNMPYINQSTGLTPGSTLFIRFWENGNDNNGTFSICAYSPIPPINDDPCNSIPLTVGTGCSFSIFSNSSATNSSGVPAPGCAVYSGGDVWFTAVVPASGQLIINSNTGDITDGGMAIYSGSCSSLTLIECDDDDSNNGLMPFINISSLTPGTTVYIRFWELGNNNNGTFSICAYSPVPCISTGTNSSCATADPFCSSNNYSYCNTIGVPSIGSEGIYGCLFTAPNPSFYYVNVATPGDISMLISQQTNAGLGIDVDFVAWGPFASQNAMCSGITASNIVDCSYSTDAVESFTISNALAGEWYMVLITNYSNSAGTINFTQVNNGSAGAGTTNCNFINATPSSCTTGNYSLSIDISGSGTLPNSGTLSITNTGGGSQVFNAPFTFPITLPNLCGNGLSSEVTADFSDPAAANFPPVSYVAPSCATLTATAGTCSAGNYVLSGTLTSSCLPTSGTLTITNSCGGSTTLNSPFSSPISWSLPASAGNGLSCTVSAVFSAANAPLVNSIPFNSPYCCVAEAGTTTTIYTGSSSTPNIICDGGTISILSNDNYSLPPAGCATCTPELNYAIYINGGPTGNDPDLDPNFSGFYWTGEDFTTANSNGFNLNSGGISSTISQLIPSSNNTWCFVPITSDASNLPNHDNNGDACYDLGTPICFQFLNPISTTLQSTCNGVVTLAVTGGSPEFSGGNYTITNTGNGTLSSTSIPNGGTFSISGLAVGISYSYTISAGGCSKSFTGAYLNTFNVTSSPASTTINAGQCVTLTGNVVSTGGNISFNNLTDYAIPDGGVGFNNSNPLINTGDWAISSINVYGVCPSIYETGKLISVSLNISHTYDRDLNIWLQSPSGTFILLSNGNGGSSNNYTNTIFSTSAVTNITAGTAPFTSVLVTPSTYFVPEQSFNLLNGSNINGTWKLWVGDDSSSDFGSILDWMIIVNTTPTTTYSWTPTTGLSSSTILNPQACPTSTTTYTLSATTNCGCTKTASSTITVNALATPTVAITAQTIACNGQANGTATATASAGTPGYTYSWNTTPVQTSAIASGLAAGTYTVTVTDANGQIATANVTITQAASPMEIFAHGTDPTCSGVCNGDATVNVVGGTSPYTYSWSNGVSQIATTQSISSLCSGTYTVTVTDANGCISSNTSTVPDCFQIQGLLVNSCGNATYPAHPSEVDEEMVFFQVGTSPLNTASINATWPTSPTTLDIWRGLCTNPTYIAAVNATITGGGVVLPMPVSGILPANANVVLITSNYLNAPVADFSNLNGTLYMIFQCQGNTGGHFSNTAATAVPFNLTFGAGCTETVSYAANSALTSDGGYVIYSTDGTPTYLNYGCTIPYTIQSNSVTLSGPSAPAAPLVNNVSYCLGASATPLSATGTNLLWYTTATGGTGSATAPTPSTAVAGTFTYYVSQTVIPCESQRSAITVTISSGSGLTPTFTLPSALCNGAIAPILPLISNNGVSGTWSPSTISNSSTGTYTFSPSTACASNFVITITVNPPLVIYPHGTNPTCSNSNNGSATVDVVGGTSPYSYSWSNGGLTQSITGLAVGNYTVTVTDANGCTSSNFVPVTNCFQIQSVLVNSYAVPEQNEEMVFFQVGPNPLNTSTLNVTWPPGGAIIWRGLCTNPTYIANANATITGGGVLLPLPVSGILPANANVVLITSNFLTTPTASFSNLTDTLYVLFQCQGNTSGQFGNSSNPSNPLILNFGSGCTQSVIYNGTLLPGGDGGYVNYSFNGTPTYLNYGVSIPYTIQSNHVTLSAPIAPTASISGSTNICSGTASSISFTGTANAVVTYTINGGANQTITLNSSGIGSLSSGNLSANTTYALVSVTSSVSPFCSQAITGNAVITVIPIPTASISGTTTICSGTASSITFTGTANALVTYTINGGANQTITLNGSGTGSLSTGNLTANATYALVSIASSGSPVCSQAVSGNAIVTVTPMPNAGTNGAITVCSNSTTVDLFNSLLGGPTSGGTWSGPSSLTGGSSGTFVPGTNTAGTYTYTLTSAGCTSTANVVVTVNPAAVVSAGSTQTICAGGFVTLAGTITGGATTGTWSAPSGSFSNVNSLTSTYTPSISTGSVTLTLTSTDPDASGPCTAATSTVVISVSPSPNVSTSGTTTICSNQTTSLPLTSSIAGATFSWTVVQSGVSGASDGSGNSIAQTLTNAGTISGTAVYTVTTTANGCTGTPTPITVTVNPLPVANFSGTTPICSPASPAITLSSNLSGTTYAWTVVQTGVSGASNGSGNSINQTLTATLTTNGTAVYTVTPTTNGCSGASLPITITVKPKPVASTLGGSYSICSGPTLATANSPSIQVLSNLGAGTTFAWTGSDGTSGSSNPISYAIPNNLCADRAITYSVTPTFNGCVGAATIIPLTVHPNPIAAFTVSASSICQNSSVTVTFTGSACPTSSYFWTWPIGAIVSGSGAGPYTVTLPNSGNFSIDLSLTNAGGFCAAQTASVPITVTSSATPITGFTYTTPVCINGTNPTVIPASGLTNGGSYSYTAIPSGLSTGLSLNTSTGAINLASSTPGSYSVTYTVAASSCLLSGNSSFTIIINPLPTISPIYHD